MSLTQPLKKICFSYIVETIDINRCHHNINVSSYSCNYFITVGMSDISFLSSKYECKVRMGISTDIMRGINHLKCSAFHLIALLCVAHVTEGRPFGRKHGRFSQYKLINWMGHKKMKFEEAIFLLLSVLWNTTVIATKWFFHKNAVSADQIRISGQHIWEYERQYPSDLSELWPC